MTRALTVEEVGEAFMQAIKKVKTLEIVPIKVIFKIGLKCKGELFLQKIYTFFVGLGSGRRFWYGIFGN